MRRLMALVVVFMFAWPAAGWAQAPGVAPFEVHFLAQGRVDAILLRCGDEAAFIDAGYHNNGLNAVNYLRAQGVTKLKYYVGTHAHKDHIGGAAALIRAFKPKKVFIPHAKVKSSIAYHAQGSAERKAARNATYKILRPGGTFSLGAARVECLGPLKIRKCSTSSTAENANSLVLRVTYGSRSLLLTGDTSSTVLTAIEKRRPGALRADILKNPHHSAALPASTLKKIAPELVVFCNSSRPGEKYGARLQKLGLPHLTASKSADRNVRLGTDGRRWMRIA